ncbi:hypothetical protein PILCRDRAFT_89625 [Piloderma croceum F 1598]|uniref:Uncharacterized protein n=1 Tax=Piloderma croceum (strain F 1598) TaxID=765440 RepID=A0A0C3FK76_PILCF|nr:hypothetical protein PILCRDRAFT_89625 [Piloderma croceum F 1598]
MKSFTTYTLLFAIVAASASAATLSTGESVDDNVITAVARSGKACAWFGTAPLCNGKCPAGFDKLTESKCGDGETCLTGIKSPKFIFSGSRCYVCTTKEYAYFEIPVARLSAWSQHRRRTKIREPVDIRASEPLDNGSIYDTEQLADLDSKNGLTTPYAPLYTSGLGLTSGDGVLHKSCEDTGIEDQPSICATDA